MSRSEAIAKLKETINEWLSKHERDGHARALCDRLKDSEAASSFAAILPDGSRWLILLDDCITAERIYRTFPLVVGGAKKDRKTAEEAIHHAEWLERYFGCRPARRPTLHLDPPNAIEQAIRTLNIAIFMKRLDTERVLEEHSQKTDLAAAVSAGVGWIKGSVRALSGKPNLDHVKVLADPALGAEVTIDTIRKAVTPREVLHYGYSAAKAKPAHLQSVRRWLKDLGARLTAGNGPLVEAKTSALARLLAAEFPADRAVFTPKSLDDISQQFNAFPPHADLSKALLEWLRKNPPERKTAHSRVKERRE